MLTSAQIAIDTQGYEAFLKGEKFNDLASVEWQSQWWAAKRDGQVFGELRNRKAGK